MKMFAELFVKVSRDLSNPYALLYPWHIPDTKKAFDKWMNEYSSTFRNTEWKTKQLFEYIRESSRFCHQSLISFPEICFPEALLNGQCIKSHQPRGHTSYSHLIISCNISVWNLDSETGFSISFGWFFPLSVCDHVTPGHKGKDGKSRTVSKKTERPWCTVEQREHRMGFGVSYISWVYSVWTLINFSSQSLCYFSYLQ